MSSPAPIAVSLPTGTPASYNVAERLALMAGLRPDAPAVVAPLDRAADGRRNYRQISFRQLEDLSNRLAGGLVAEGVAPGTRLALLVPPSIEFIALVFALLKAGAVSILIDPGMGRRNLLGCLADAEPAGFIGIPLVHVVRRLFARRFPASRLHVVVGPRRWPRDVLTLDELAERAARNHRGTAAPVARAVPADEPAAIIFTTGSTGPPKGVLYRHGNFYEQAAQLQQFYGIQPGEVDLPGFPLFGLFNAALGVTTVIPDMDPTRPARVEPTKIIEAVHDWQVTQSFGSPAFWNRVGRYCETEQVRLPTLRRVMSAGAPVPAHVLARVRAAMAPDGEVHTPYGATEALPVASIAAREVLGETAEQTRRGAGVCVGRHFPSIRWKVIGSVDGPLPTLADAEELPAGEIGELIVSGPVVTTEYVTRREANPLSKIRDGDGFWHRMGDVGYLDAADRFWYCGRLTHRVLTAAGPLYTERCEAIFVNHPDIYRAALVGLGPPGRQRPVIICEPWPGRLPRDRRGRERLLAELAELGQTSPLTAPIRDFLLHRSLPVDIRHNAKIFREKLVPWAARRVRAVSGSASRLTEPA